MFARKFIDHVDTHAEQLCEEFMQKIRRSEKCSELLRRVPAEDQRQTTREIYENLTRWLLTNTDTVTEERYVSLGMRRAQQKVPLSELFWAVCATREYFWEYTERETLLDKPEDFWGGVRLLYSLDRFFDRALYFVIVGYEAATNSQIGQFVAVSTKK
jgi:hypothetical protein